MLIIGDRLENEQENKNKHENKTHRRVHSSSTYRHKHRHRNSTLNEVEDRTILSSFLSYPIRIIQSVSTVDRTPFLFNIVLIAGFVLLILHVCLCYKIYSIAKDLFTQNTIRSGH